MEETGVSEGKIKTIHSNSVCIVSKIKIRINRLTDAIKLFSDGPVDEIDENNMNLKCYMYCLLRAFENYEVSHDFDEFDFFTSEETEILIDMMEKCDSYEYNERDDEKCEYAFQLSKCWKMANPEVCSYVNVKHFQTTSVLPFFSLFFQYYFLL